MQVILLVVAAAVLLCAWPLGASAADESRSRVIVLTDISNEPDDEESLVRFLVYANEFEVEGLVATTSTWLKDKTREDLIRRQLQAYAQVRPNLLKHAPNFPEAEKLLAVTCTGQPGYGMASVGAGKETTGSRRIIDAIDRADERPLWVSVWGGANTLAQALTDLRASRSADALKRAVAKLRVYTISDQDDAGAWIRKEFPDLFYIVSPSNPDSQEYWRTTWTGISGDRWYKNGPGHKFELVENAWLDEHVINNHGPLGALYPNHKYIMEGDTPSFLGLVDNGLGWSVSPSYGGWGGRYVLYKAHGETRPIWTNNNESRDTVTADNGKTETTDPATIWRWREHYQNDFAARMDWCIADVFHKANHNPQVVLNGDATKNVLTIPAESGAMVPLSAEGTKDPDGNTVRVRWWIYHEPGGVKAPRATLSTADGLATEVRLPEIKRPQKVHVICEAEDDGTPRLYAYRRAILDLTPSAGR